MRIRHVSFGAGDGPSSVDVADLDDDTVPDLVTANIDSDDASVLLGNGDGSFQAAVAFAVGDFPVSVAVADMHARMRAKRYRHQPIRRVHIPKDASAGQTPARPSLYLTDCR